MKRMKKYPNLGEIGFMRSILLILVALMMCPVPSYASRWRAPRSRARAAGCVDNPQAMAHRGSRVVPWNNGIDFHVTQILLDEAERIAEAPSLRNFTGGKVVISSGYRSCAHNARVRGSARNSAHLRGHAIDILSSSPYNFANAIQQSGLHKGGGFYNMCVRHVHLDTEHPGYTNECGGKTHFRRLGRN